MLQKETNMQPSLVKLDDRTSKKLLFIAGLIIFGIILIANLFIIYKITTLKTVSNVETTLELK